MTPVEVNYVAIIVAVLIYAGVGAIWYSPKVFGSVWMESMGYRPEELAGQGKGWIGSIVCALVMSYILALFIHYLGINTVVQGAYVGFLAWLGFILPTLFSNVLWENRPLKVFFIHAGCMLLTLILMGAVIGGTMTLP